MTIRFNENDLNAAHGIVKLDASGNLPALDGSLLTNLNVPPALLDNDFDGYQVEVVSADTTMAEGKLYIVTASCQMAFGPGTENGDRIGILIPDNGITVTLRAVGGSLGTGRRFCINGTCYGDSVADSTMGATSNGTLNISGKGKCLEFVRHNDGIRTGWIEQSHTKYFDTAGGATEAGNWANFDKAIATNAATGTDNRQSLVFNGTDWVWRKVGIDTKSYSRASDGGTLTLLPLAGYQYGDYEVNFLTTSTTNWTSGYVCNLQAYSAVERDAIHMKPLIFLIQDNKVAINNVSPVNVWPNYLIRFIDNTAGVTFQQVADFDANATPPYTQQSALGIRDPNFGTNHYLTYCGVVIMFDYDQQKWYRLRHLYRPS
jgi:hypothetical protein